MSDTQKCTFPSVSSRFSESAQSQITMHLERNILHNLKDESLFYNVPIFLLFNLEFVENSCLRSVWLLTLRQNSKSALTESTVELSKLIHYLHGYVGERFFCVMVRHVLACCC